MKKTHLFLVMFMWVGYAQAQDFITFIDFPDIPGEYIVPNTRPNNPSPLATPKANCLLIKDFEHEIRKPINLHVNSAGGSAADKSENVAVSIRFDLDKSLIALYNAYLLGTVIPEVYININTNTDPQKIYSYYQFSNIRIISIEDFISEDGAPITRLEFFCEKYRHYYVPYNNAGLVQTPISTGWNYANNTTNN